MSEFVVVATRKDGPDHDRRIDALKLNNGLIYSEDQIIRAYDLGDRFTTKVTGFPVVEVVPAHRGLGRYLKTQPDNLLGNNLLHLPNC